jgi:hypothetical protein
MFSNSNLLSISCNIPFKIHKLSKPFGFDPLRFFLGSCTVFRFNSNESWPVWRLHWWQSMGGIRACAFTKVCRIFRRGTSASMHWRRRKSKVLLDLFPFISWYMRFVQLINDMRKWIWLALFFLFVWFITTVWDKGSWCVWPVPC